MSLGGLISEVPVAPGEAASRGWRGICGRNGHPRVVPLQGGSPQRGRWRWACVNVPGTALRGRPHGGCQTVQSEVGSTGSCVQPRHGRSRAEELPIPYPQEDGGVPVGLYAALESCSDQSTEGWVCGMPFSFQRPNQTSCQGGQRQILRPTAGFSCLLGLHLCRCPRACCLLKLVAIYKM